MRSIFIKEHSVYCAICCVISSNLEAFQLVALIESPTPYIGYAVRNYYSRQVHACFKCTFFNGYNTIRNYNAFQVSAKIKSIRTNAGHTFRDLIAFGFGIRINEQCVCIFIKQNSIN